MGTRQAGVTLAVNRIAIHFLLPLSSLPNANAQTQRTLFTLIPLNARNENQYAVERTSGVAGIARMYTIKHHPLLRSSKKP